MRVYLVLLVAAVALLASSEVLTSAAKFKSSQTQISSQISPVVPCNDKNCRRLLRAAIDSGDTENTEERGVLSSLGNWMKTKYWVSFEKSDDYVKKKLGLQGLTGKALTDHPNYKTLQKFWYKLEGRVLNKWYDDDVILDRAWSYLKLDRIREDHVMKTDAFRIYVRYVKKYDDDIYWYKNSLFEPPIEYGGTDAQMFAKVRVWAETNRPRWYVKEMLEIDHLSEANLLANRFYKKYLRLTGKDP